MSSDFNTKPLTPLLDSIGNPEELRDLTAKELPQLADELRAFMIYAVGNSGGHFASGLGVVELTIALHYVFDTPTDNLIWDVGHQSYPHKILTERKNKLHTIRQFNGLAPFTDRLESKYDAFISGHASTSISAALGMKIADDYLVPDNNKQTIAVIGDGSLTGGMAFEALNHAGNLDKNLIVILNDNNMSISNNVGALSKHFSAFFASGIYQTMRSKQQTLPSILNYYNKFANKSEQQLKGLVLPNNIFEQLGFQYFGPIDGHDLPFLLNMLNKIKRTSGPILLHIATKKGRGYTPAEQNPILFHAINKNNTSKQQTTYANIFGQWIVHQAKLSKKLHAITPAMCEGSDLIEFKDNFPDRYHDVGIAEQHALTLSAGMAVAGLKPVVAIYSTFLQRAYDQLIHDACLQNLDITLAVDRAGIVGGDGATHQGVFDLSFLRAIPNITILAPSNGEALVKMLDFAYKHKAVVVVRYPRGDIPDTAAINITNILNKKPIKLATANIVKIADNHPKKRGVILSFGAVLGLANELADNYNMSLVDMQFIKPLDKSLLLKLLDEYDYFVTIEENVIMGGAGSAVAEFCMEEGKAIAICMLGLEDKFYAHGSPEEIKQSSLSITATKAKLANWLTKTFN